jgi:hypothetical protein
VRYLGWFTAVSDDVDEPQKQAAEEVNERTTEDCHKECWGQKSRSLLKPANRYSNTGEDGIRPLQTAYNELTSQKEESTKRCLTT